MIYIMNGPPGSGKDFACEHLKYKGVKHLRMKDALFDAVIDEFKVDKDWFMTGYNDRVQKELPEEKLSGKSRREAMIYVSEEIIKPKYGKSFFGDISASKIDTNSNYCFSDGGFVEEINPIINKVGADNILIIQLSRDGCDYSSDSRRYFRGNVIDEITVVRQTLFEEKYTLDEKLPLNIIRIHNNGSLNLFTIALNLIYYKDNKNGNNPEQGTAEGTEILS